MFNQDHNSIVPLRSQLDGKPGSAVDRVIHSSGLTPLGFTGPCELDACGQAAPSDIATRVVKLLNTPVTNTDVFVPVP